MNLVPTSHDAPLWSALADCRARREGAVAPDLRALLERARAAEARGDRDGLETYARAALARRPDHVAPYYPLARAGRAGAVELRCVLGRLEPGAPGEVPLRFALGHALDRAGDPDGAFAAWTRGCRLRVARLARPFDPEAFERELEATALPAARAADGADRSLRPVLLVGLPRSGSSLVEQILAAHPAVHALGECGALARVDDATAYRAVAGVPPGATVVTDKTLGNLGRLALARRLFPEVRVVHCRRHPGDAGLSAYSLLFRGETCSWSYDLEHIARVRRACEGHLARARATGVLPWLEVPYEELCADPRGWTARLLEFVGLSWDDACLRFHRSDRPVATSSAGQVQEPVHERAVGRWRAYARWLGPLLDQNSV